MSTEETITRRGMQNALMRGLSQYLNDEAKRRGLEPLHYWSPRNVTDGELSEIRGQAGRAEFEDPVKVVEAWADAFGVETSVVSPGSFATLDAVFEVDGVKVLVWCPIGEWD